MAILEKFPDQKGRLDSQQPTLMAQLVELQEENARLREDAERYRWLRDSSNPDIEDKQWILVRDYGDKYLDAAIDAARKEQK